MVAFSCAGCAREAGESGDDSGGDEETDEAAAPAHSFTSAFSFHKHYAGKTDIVVPVHGTVTVSAHATWSKPGKCKLPTFKINLVKVGLAGSEGQRVYATSGSASTQTWVNLGVGTYHLVFDSDNDENDCELAGSVTVNVAP
jgi:hypothetical protein